ncbi:hypothetical protein GRAN_1639 [Granulicella sibirica]|uniref:Uncharacterized protein n=1 Tax=Granulicella sibirica TaxID=2479048 RepID=A0A4Q0T8G7_9BACT|nr:hypothetical protein GRAN_1639 [Granulicella sibirica]
MHAATTGSNINIVANGLAQPLNALTKKTQRLKDIWLEKPLSGQFYVDRF